jgi:hypothetical protein
MDGHDPETNVFKSTGTGAESLDSDIFSTFNFLSASPSDPRMLHDVDIDPLALNGDGEREVFESIEKEREYNHEPFHESVSNESQDVKPPVSTIIIEDATLPKAAEIVSAISGLKFDSANPLLYRESPENCEDTTTEKEYLTNHQSKDLNLGSNFGPRIYSTNLESTKLPHTASSKAMLPQDFPDKNSAMCNSPMWIDGLHHPPPTGRRRSQSMPPAEMTFYGRRMGRNILPIGSPMVQRHNTTNLITRHHPYANARRNHANVEIYSPSIQVQSLPKSHNHSPHLSYNFHPGGAITVPGSPNKHIDGALSFSNSDPNHGNYIGRMCESHQTDSEKHIVNRAAQIFPAELHRSLDPIATIQKFTRGVFQQLDLVMETIRKDLLAFVEEPELEL